MVRCTERWIRNYFNYHYHFPLPGKDPKQLVVIHFTKCNCNENRTSNYIKIHTYQSYPSRHKTHTQPKTQPSLQLTITKRASKQQFTKQLRKQPDVCVRGLLCTRFFIIRIYSVRIFRLRFGTNILGKLRNIDRLHNQLIPNETLCRDKHFKHIFGGRGKLEINQNWLRS